MEWSGRQVQITWTTVGEVAAGAVVKHSNESNMVREAVLKTALDPETPGIDIQKACTTGIEAVITIANKIAQGQIEAGIAGGVDSMSNLPIGISDKYRKALLKANSAKSFIEKIKIFSALSLKDLKPVPYRGQEPETGLTMGEHTELTAAYYGITRQQQDELALKSHLNLTKAYDEGFYDDIVTPFAGLSQDNTLRRDTSMEKLGKLKPAFPKTGQTMTAGNSTNFTDGASGILLASEEWAAKHNLPVLAYVTYAETGAIEYVRNQHNLLLAPVIVAPRMLEKANLKLQDFDFYEIHEAFAAQVLATLKIWGDDELSRQFGLPGALGKIDMERLNVAGSSLATGHPFAATGGKVVSTLAKLLYMKGSGRGLISVCAARGQGSTMILER
ncbi:acetyl-CoA C-acetyltransferase [Taibaiella lutea]|uniref:acetyl-CoA C-acetyltransferase n=1 Tax=Taibaiella lutea TaxID=2608001 RepID=UPI001C128DE1|nr:acetyl-CoA C-acetyltransferase [Taibaiella lutea]